MLKAKLMNQVKDKFGGTFEKKNGKWYWKEELVTTNWLLNKLNKIFRPDEPIGKKLPVQEEMPIPQPQPIQEVVSDVPVVKKSAPKKKKESETL
jgi:hypothetical protein